MHRLRRALAYSLGLFALIVLIVKVGMPMMDEGFQKTHRIKDLEQEGLPSRTIRGPDSFTIRYFRAGDPARGRVIYCHGTPGEGTNWSAYLLDPVGGMDSITFDRIGFGQTVPAVTMADLPTQAAAMKPFLDLPGPKAVLVGHSLGGAVVVQAALDYPDRVAGLVIAAGSLDPGLEEWKWYNRLADWRIARMVIPEEMGRSNDELRPFKGELEALAARLGELKVPVIIVHSTDDSLVPFENVAFMERSFPEGTIRELIQFDDRDHFVIWNAQEAVREAVLGLAEANG